MKTAPLFSRELRIGRRSTPINADDKCTAFRVHRRSSAAPIFLAYVLLSSAGYAQVASATLSGTVMDPQSRPVPKVRVTVTQDATGFSRSTTTDERGLYVFEPIAPGEYTITARFEGFNPYELAGVAIQLNQRARHDIALTLGVGHQVIETSALSPVNTDDATVGYRLDQ